MLVSPFATVPVASTVEAQNLAPVTEPLTACHAYDFGFNNPQFSDRVLHVLCERGTDRTEARGAVQQDAPLLSMHVNSLTLAANSEVFRYRV